MSDIRERLKTVSQLLVILVLVVLSGFVLGASVATAAKSIKNPPIQIISINEETLFRELSLKLAKLNLDEKSLKKRLSEFKKALMDLLKDLPPNFVVVRSNVLLRNDNVSDLTETFKLALFEKAEEAKK